MQRAFDIPAKGNDIRLTIDKVDLIPSPDNMPSYAV